MQKWKNQGKCIIGCIGLTLFSLLYAGCAKIALNCPVSGPPMVATVNGPDVVGTVGALTSVIGTLLATKGAPPVHMAADSPAQSGGTATLNTLVFTSAAQTISCGPQPTVTH